MDAGFWHYTALGGERYITIGNFLPDDLTNFNNASGSAAYYFLDDVSVMKCSQVGVSVNDLVEQSKSLSIFPNPASDQITVKGCEAKSEILIANAVGKIVKSVKPNVVSHQAVIDVSNLPNGLYIITHIETAYGLTSQAKLVVIR
jgi:hypothetical protein